MTDAEMLKSLRLFYAGLMVDSASNFEGFGVSEKVAAKKAAEQLAAAPAQLAQLGIGSPRELFERFTELFGCAIWEVEELALGGAAAVASSCLACAIAKRRGSGRPCSLYCINPFRAYASALGMELTVGETLWEGGKCAFKMESLG